VKHRVALLVSTLALGLATWPRAASAQAPTEIFRCLGTRDDPTCTDITGPIVITQCPRHFEIFYGRVAWYPIRNVGPVTISVETFAHFLTRFPLYVEVVPIDDRIGVCDNAPGNVVMVARGGQSPCGTWETVGPIDISPVVPIGSNYALRLRFFGSPGGESPAVGCVRVTPNATAVLPSAWTTVKGLYR
jgi:hypothetical protein